jgi:hypothetical protein
MSHFNLDLLTLRFDIDIGLDVGLDVFEFVVGRGHRCIDRSEAFQVPFMFACIDCGGTAYG